MRIISPFKDYYDNQKCFSHCSDDFMYVRKTSEELPVDMRIEYTWELDIPDRLHREYYLELIGFCGEYYPIIKQTTSTTHYSIKTRYLHKNVWPKLLDKHDLKRQLERYRRRNTKDLYKELDRRLNEILKNTITEAKKLNLFTKHKTPILHLTLSLRNNKLTLNPPLEPMGFASIIEGHQAYQQIEQFLGSELLEFDNPNQITDDLVLAGNHGFNKHSFRGKLHIPKRKRKNKK